MFDFDGIENLLRRSFDDFRLSNEEKHLIRLQLKDVEGPEVLNFTRNQAFKIAKSHIANHSEHHAQALKWVEAIVKTLDVLRQGFDTSKSPVAFFSPGNHCVDKIIALLKKATQSVDICVFTISDDRISGAILDAHKRGVAVRIISDNHKSEDMGSDIEYLKEKGVNIIMDASHNHMHHKFAVFDKEVLLNGSFNWTRSATRYNQENIVLHYDKPLIKQFQKEFEKLWLEFS